MKKHIVAAMAAGLIGASVTGASAQAILSGQGGPVVIVNQTPQASAAAIPQQSVTPAVVTVRSGILVLNLTITLTSVIPATVPIKCGFFPIVFGSAPVLPLPPPPALPTYLTDYLSESRQVTATRTGVTATCSLSVPYSWSLEVLAADRIQINYSVTAVDANGIGRISQTTPFLVFTPGGAQGIPVPTNGATTTIARSVRL